MDEQPQEEDEGLLTPQLRELIAELDAWLQGEPDEKLVGHVLPFATEWVLKEIEGLDVKRYTEEAKLFVLATPLADRVLLRYPDDVAYWVGQRMLVNADHEPELELARAVLDTARELIGERAALLEQEGYRNVAAGFRRLLDESSYRERAGQIAAQIDAMPGPRDGVALLERLAADRAPLVNTR